MLVAGAEDPSKVDKQIAGFGCHTGTCRDFPLGPSTNIVGNQECYEMVDKFLLLKSRDLWVPEAFGVHKFCTKMYFYYSIGLP